MHILHTVLYTFPKELIRRICLIIKNLVGDHFLYSPVLDVLFTSKEKLDASHFDVRV